MVDKLKEYVAVHFCDQATVAARAMEELKPPVFVKTNCPVRMYWADKGQTRTTNNKRNFRSTVDNLPKSEDWEHKLIVEEYLEKCKFRKEGTKA